MPQMTPQEVFRVFQDIEDVFPIQTPSAEVTAGTYDCATGQFTGLVSTYDPNPSPPPPLMRIYPRAAVNAVNITLVFNVINNQNQVVTFRVEGDSYEVAPGESSIKVDVGTAQTVSWSVEGSRPDKIYFDRPPLIGMGAFSVPVVPIAIVYEPPAGQSGRGQATYTESTTVGVATGMILQNDSSVTQSSRPTSASVFNEFSSDLKTLSDIVGTIPLEELQQASGFLKRASDIVATVVGGKTQDETVGSRVTDERRQEFFLTLGTQLTTGSSGQNLGGPGLGDVFYVMLNARFLWLCGPGGVRLAFLDADGTEQWTAKKLVEDLAFVRRGPFVDDVAGTNRPSPRGPNTGFTRGYLEALVGLDPFAGVSPEKAPMEGNGRFESMGYVGGDQEAMRSYGTESTRSDVVVETDYKVTITNYRKGLASILGIGPSENKKVVTSFSLGEMKSRTTTSRSNSSVTIGPSASPAVMGYGVYLDRLFGTLAVRDEPRPPVLILAGRLLGHGRHGVANTPVTAEYNGLQLYAQTDREGRFEFYANAPHSGSLVVAAAGIRRTVQLSGHPIRNLELMSR